MSVCAARPPSQGVLAAFSLAVCLSSTAGADEALALFNGKDLEGWTAKVTGHPLGANPGSVFRVEDGLLKVRYDSDPYRPFNDQFGHLFYQTPFSHYALRLVYRFVGDQAPGGPDWARRNSGVMVHAQPASDMTLHQPFPVSIEAQFLGGLGDAQPRPTANVCTPGTHINVAGVLYTPHCLSSGAGTFDGEQWVEVIVTVLGGGRITHHVNGEEVIRYNRPQLGDGESAESPAQYLSSGYIALQSESHPVDFKVVELVNLAGCTDPEAINYQPHALKREAGSCRYP